MNVIVESARNRVQARESIMNRGAKIERVKKIQARRATRNNCHNSASHLHEGPTKILVSAP
jgi:hypothetical protein